MLWARVEARLLERRELAHALLSWVSTARQEPGAVSAHLAEDMEDAGSYCFFVGWRERQQLERHLASGEFGVLLGALQVLAHRWQIEVATTASGEDSAALINRIRHRVPEPEE